MKFNINNCVKVKLTDLGLEVHKKHYDKFLPTFISQAVKPCHLWQGYKA